jgi:guanine deaminase
VLPEAGDPLAVGLGNAKNPEDALAKVFALGTTSDVGGVWVGADQIAAGRWRRPPLT